MGSWVGDGSNDGATVSLNRRCWIPKCYPRLNHALDRLRQHPFQTGLADALAPARQRTRIDRRSMLEPGLAAEQLPIRVLDPAPHYVLVGQGERVLQVQQARDEPRGGGGTAARGREMPGPFALEDAPVDVGAQLCQRMLQVDQFVQPLAEHVCAL